MVAGQITARRSELHFEEVDRKIVICTTAISNTDRSAEREERIIDAIGAVAAHNSD